MMKIVLVPLFHLAVIVAAWTPGDLQDGGLLWLKMNYLQIYGCVSDCDAYVDEGSCDSLCKGNATKFTTLINTVYQRAKKPICDITLSDIPLGEATIPLTIEGDDRDCYMKGPLNVRMTRKNVAAHIQDGAAIYPRYHQKAEWDVKFLGMTMYCEPFVYKVSLSNSDKIPSCLVLRIAGGDTRAQVVGRVDVTLDYSFDQYFILSDQEYRKLISNFAD